MLDMISILNVLRFVLSPNMWSILEDFPCALEKYLCSGALGCNAFNISIKSIKSGVSFKALSPVDFLCGISVH